MTVLQSFLTFQSELQVQYRLYAIKKVIHKKLNILSTLMFIVLCNVSTAQDLESRKKNQMVHNPQECLTEVKFVSSRNDVAMQLCYKSL